tara:strand:+ start:10015 stop:10227 length:213 start_codon:yes stop_codon:yes gene_type:complete
MFLFLWCFTIIEIGFGFAIIEIDFTCKSYRPPTKAVRFRQVIRDYGKQGWMKSRDRVAVEQMEKKRNKEK